MSRERLGAEAFDEIVAVMQRAADWDANQEFVDKLTFTLQW